MQLTDVLAQMGGLQSMAKELGISEGQAASGAEALIPAILGGFKKQAQAQPGGLDGLGGLLGQLGGGGLLDQVLAPQPADTAPGNEVLGQIFGSKEVSRTVAQDAASHTGLAPSVLQKMLPLLAMLVTGYLAKQGTGTGTEGTPTGGGLGGGLGDLLGGLLGGQRGGGAASMASMFDANGDGNPLDDILRMAGKAMR
jgi:hypothetical protein